MKRIILVCLLMGMAFSSQAQKLNYTIMVEENHPLVLTQYVFLITPEHDLYWQKSGLGITKIYRTKITEEQYSSLFSDEYKGRLLNACSEDSIYYGMCWGIDESSSATITILIKGFRIKHIGQCSFPSGFDELFGFLRKNEPKFSRYTGKLTRRSSKRWEKVSEMPRGSM